MENYEDTNSQGKSSSTNVTEPSKVRGSIHHQYSMLCSRTRLAKDNKKDTFFGKCDHAQLESDYGINELITAKSQEILPQEEIQGW